MSFGAITAVASAAIAVKGAVDAFGADSGDSNLAGFQLPEFADDPLVAETQEFLNEIGQNFLKGDFGEFSSLAETGSPEFEALLQRTMTDIRRGTEESFAKQGRSRGGGVTAASAEAVGDATAQLRFDDFMRAQQGKAGLLATGGNLVQGVRTSAQNNQLQKNNFALGRSELDLAKRQGLDRLDLQIGEAQGQSIADLVTAGAGIASVFKKDDADPQKNQEQRSQERIVGGLGGIEDGPFPDGIPGIGGTLPPLDLPDFNPGSPGIGPLDLPEFDNPFKLPKGSTFL